jgi:hypothetical protein
MSAVINKHQYDALDYVRQIKKFGGDEKMAEYQTRYINHSIESAIDRAIEKLNLSQFATKSDITKLENDIKHLEARLELKMFKHTVFIMSVIVLTSPSVKELVMAILHLR